MPTDYVILGASGYIGQAFVEELENRGRNYIPLSRSTIDYTRFRPLLNFLEEARPQFLINCAGYTGKPNVDACEKAKNDTVLGNITLVESVANACDVAGIAFGHVSSGCIYSGAKLRINGGVRVVKNLMAPEIKPLWENDRDIVEGFTEDDEPNFSFDDPPCSFYSGTKAAAEKLLKQHGNHFVWRLRIPFDERANPRNYLTKLMTYPKLYDNANSLSHRGDFARGCVELWEKRCDFGTFNVTNTGWVTTKAVGEMIRRCSGFQGSLVYFDDDSSFYKTAAVAPRSNAIMSIDTLESFGIVMDPVEKAIQIALKSLV